MFTSVPDAPIRSWILPRTLVYLAYAKAVLSNPESDAKKSPTALAVGDFLAEDEGFEFPQVITFCNKSSQYIHKYMRYRNFLVALLTTIYYPILPL